MFTASFVIAAMIATATPSPPSAASSQIMQSTTTIRRPSIMVVDKPQGPVASATWSSMKLENIQYVITPFSAKDATATFTGQLLHGGKDKSVQVRVGFVHTDQVTGEPWRWYAFDEKLVSATPPSPISFKAAVKVPVLIPRGIGRGVYKPHVELIDPLIKTETPPDRPKLLPKKPRAPRQKITLEPIISEVSREESLGFKFENSRVELTRPGRQGNEAIFTAQLYNTKTVMDKVTVRCGFVNPKYPKDSSFHWFLDKSITIKAPRMGQSKQIKVPMRAHNLIHKGMEAQLYIPTMAVVHDAPAKPLIPVRQSEILDEANGIKLLPWKHDITKPGQVGCAVVFSGTVENTGKAVQSFKLRAGFKPIKPIMVNGRMQDTSHWPWKSEVDIKGLKPGEQRPFKAEVEIPPKMHMYIGKTYHPKIIMHHPLAEK
jgi:hypothetical protein